MQVSQILLLAVRELQARELRFALAGGIVASVYRQQIRATADVDMLVLTDDETAVTTIQRLGFTAAKASIANLRRAPMMNKKSAPSLMVIGRLPQDTSTGLDFILPTMPWFARSLDRAEKNLLDFGFGRIPALTAEDVVISKLHTISYHSIRDKDKDDVQEILLAEKDLDLDYLCAEVERLKISAPRDLERHFPKPLRLVSKRIRNDR